MANIVNVLEEIEEIAVKEQAEAKKKWLDKIEVLEEVAKLFDDNKDPLTAMELRRAAGSLKALSIIRNL
jgi:hypothetical protein